MNSWYQLTVQTPVESSDRLSSLLFDLGSSGLEVGDPADDTTVSLTAYFSGETNRIAVLAHVERELASINGGLVVAGISDVPNEDWGAKWREHFEPVYPTERMVIHPPWQTVEPPVRGFTLTIEPKTAFGTGSHPTTRMALMGLERAVSSGDRVLDVGTGSGVLSIAAILLGATAATAVDTDPLATENVAENVVLNDVSGVEWATRGVSRSDTGYDVTVANIIRSVLAPLLPILALSVRPGGHIILGGLLDREESAFVRAVEVVDLEIVEITREAEWIGLITKSKGQA